MLRRYLNNVFNWYICLHTFVRRTKIANNKGIKKIEMRRKDFGDFITSSYYSFITIWEGVLL